MFYDMTKHKESVCSGHCSEVQRKQHNRETKHNSTSLTSCFSKQKCKLALLL